MKVLLLVGVLWATSSFAQSANHCEQFNGKGLVEDLVKQLSQKLSYDYDAFCSNPRIADIFTEEKLVYHREDDQNHPYQFITIHYYEYSCEYQYSMDEKRWRNQSCYSTW